MSWKNWIRSRQRSCDFPDNHERLWVSGFQENMLIGVFRKIGRTVKSVSLCCAVTFCISSDVLAGFFEMPEITEMPEVQRKSLLKDLDIPSVRERSPDPEAGPRLNVTRFKLEGIVEYPELGITQKEIEVLIEGIREDLMNEFQVLESGFTEQEIEEVAELVGEIEEETLDRHVSELEVQKLVWLIREQRSKRGVTLGQIEAVADRITQFYRERGFILAKAYIPRQQVRDGVVTLTLLLGLLGEAQVYQNELYTDVQLTSIFDQWRGLPVTTSVVEENLYLLNDYPGLSVTGFFQAGSQVGDSRLNLNVRNETRYEKSLRLDNHGSDQTGEYRLYGEFKVNNPLGLADQLALSALYAFDPDNSEYSQLSYLSRGVSPRLGLGFSMSNNDFVLGPGNNEAIDKLGLSGETRQREVTASYSFRRSRTLSLYGDYRLAEIESELDLELFTSDDRLDDTVRNHTLAFRFDVLNEQDQVLHQGNVGLTSGEFDEGAEVGQDERYSILTVDYTRLSFWQPFFTDSNTRLVYRLGMQWTESALSSINQYSLAGASRVRGYESNQFSGDSAIFMAVDWFFNSPQWMDTEWFGVNLQRVTRPFVFLDLAWGETYALVSRQDDETGEMLGAGFGLQFSSSGSFQGNLQVAFPVEESFSSSDVVVSDDTRFIFDFQYSFD